MPSSDAVISEIEQAWHSFYLEYGTAMVSWQMLESELATLFSKLTNIPPAMAIQIFYSATSFNGRIDIFSASLAASKAHEDAITFAQSIIGKARSYSAFRNKFAHDQPLLHQHGRPAKFEIIMVHGRGQFQSDEVKKRYLDAAITVAQIREAADAFRDLSALIRDFWAQPATRNESLDALRARLEALPGLPRPKDQSPRPVKPKRQRVARRAD
jgi:hypothetical protein